MESIDYKLIYQKAISVYGVKEQMRQTQEECAELIADIGRFMRTRIDDNKLASEIADVEIMIDQMRILIGNEKVDAAKNYKVRRLADRLNYK